jgi:hypothetical protein
MSKDISLVEMRLKVISALHRIGPMSSKDIKDMTGIDSRYLGTMQHLGFIKSTEAYGESTWCVTNAGRQSCGIETERKGIVRGRLHVPEGSYLGEELRPFSGRPGCNDAFSLPSLGTGG